MNAYSMMLDVRDNIAEQTAKKWDDANIQRKLNTAQRKLTLLLSMSPGDWLVVSTDLTPSDSLITLPSDCMKPVYMEEADTGIPIELNSNVRDRSIGRVPGSSLGVIQADAYLLKDYIEVNQAGYSNGVTLWYQKRVPDLALGVAGSGSGAAVLEFQKVNTPSGVDDYYNGVSIETMHTTNLNVLLSDTITDYVGSTVKATITGTPSSGDFYGTISTLPEECHALMVLMATTTLLASPGAALDTKYFDFFVTEMSDLLKTFKLWISTRKSGSSYTRTTEVE